MEQAIALNKAEPVNGITFDWTALIEPTKRELRKMAADGAKQSLAQVRVNDDGITDLANENAIAWADERAAELVGMKWDDAAEDYVPNPSAVWRIDDVTREGINDLVVQALDEGWSNDTLAENIRDSYLFSDARAETIARTETARADVQGNLIGYSASGVVIGKEWITADDEDVSSECQANAAQGVIGLEDSFVSGADAPPEHPNCRCDVLPVVGEED